MRLSSTCFFSMITSAAVLACSGSGASVQPPQGSIGGSIFGQGGGDANTGGSASQGGVPAQGGAATGGDAANGGRLASGGNVATGGRQGAGGAATGGRTSGNGGSSGVGGKTSTTGGNAPNTGGVTNETGGAAIGNGGSSSAPSGGRPSTGGAVATGGSQAPSTCEDVVPQGTPCATWKEWNQCGSAWFTQNGFCQNTCNACPGSTPGTGGAPGIGGAPATGGAGPGNGGTPATGGNAPTGGNAASGGTRATGGNAPTGGTTSVSTATNTPITGDPGWASRYWDCCKPSCSWTSNVPSCGFDGTTRISSRDTTSGCDNGAQNSAYECYDFSPWYDASTNMSYGFVAHNQVACGTCYQIQFTGEGHDGANPGASAIKGKQMIVQVINIGGIGSDQFDLLIPGGGVGAMTKGCTAQWGNVDLGATYGGLYANSGGNCATMKTKCQSVFGSKPALLAGCLWFTDWYQCADNPRLVYKKVTCPSQITQKTNTSAH